MTKEISELVHSIEGAKNPAAKIALLEEHPEVRAFFNDPLFQTLLADDLSSSYILKELVIILGNKQLKSWIKEEPFFEKKLRSLIEKLVSVESFYASIGGLLGYQLLVTSLLFEKESPVADHIYAPHVEDISKETSHTQRLIYEGIAHLPMMAEIYPLGGAADRLHLQDEATKKELPAAKLLFCGRTLLETLISDVEAREYLYYKLFGQSIHTPIAIMTSHEKDNHEHVLSIFRDNNWFHRSKETIQFFLQPSVPTFTEKGEWCFTAPFEPLLKPGGHGAIWKLGVDAGIFQQFQHMGRRKALIRQINNPIAGIDYGLLAFTGYGALYDQDFGFSSCPREPKMAEGINVLAEKRTEDGYEQFLTNVEYCDLSHRKMKEEDFAKFPSNTNILFADIEAVQKATKKLPMPGALINLKEISFISQGREIKRKVARLESTMQNIADAMRETSYIKATKPQKSFITLSKRLKTISTTKRVYQENQSLETPEKAFYDLLRNRKELFDLSNIKAPGLPSFDEFMKKGPAFLFHYHPALGPLYQIISQKLHTGHIHEGSELLLDIAELSMTDFEISGSLLIQAKNSTGHIEKGVRIYSDKVGRCELHNVKIVNKGFSHHTDNIYWKGRYSRNEALTITLEGNGEFFAQDVTFHGSHSFHVQENERVIIYQETGKLHKRVEKINTPSWKWVYQADDNYAISLHKQKEKSLVKSY